MNVFDVLNVLSDGLLLKLDFENSILFPPDDVDVTESCICVVRELKKLSDDILYSRVLDIDVFGDIMQVEFDANYSDGSSLHSFTLSDALRLMSVDSYCSINSGTVCGEADYLLKCLSPDFLGLTVAGISVDDDCDIEFTLIDK